MRKFAKVVAAIMLLVAVVFASGCKKDPDNGGNGSNPTTEGIYLGIIGFNYNLYPKEIGLLNSSTKSSFTNFIDNLSMENLTGLYYADYTALKKLQAYGEPPKLSNVALVTFTDGLDNASLDDEERNPENYSTREAYLSALNHKIKTEKIHGKSIEAYSIGLKGPDVQDVAAFQNNLKKLASDDNNVFEVASMDEALQRFEEIAESLHSTSMSSSLSLLVPPGYDDGLVLRFTFDQVNSASNSSLFIECTYKRTSDGRRLDNITYRGFKQGASSLTSVEKLSNGFYKFVFQNLKKDNDSFITETDKNRLKLYRQISSGWEHETEFDNSNQSSVIEEQSSALIMLVLDCTTSLGNQFPKLKSGAIRFVETLVSSNGGGNNGGSTGGGNGTYNGHDYVDLGLPSGTLWATCNVGTSVPGDYGSYYAWGETQPKTTYNWSTYKYCSGITYDYNYADYEYPLLTKYCTESNYGYNGFTDDLTTLNPSDDVATVNWGSGWRMPTKEEYEELLNHTNSITTTQNGMRGKLLTSTTNGNSIFLPYSGYRNGNDLKNAGNDGLYRSSSLYPDNANRSAWILYIIWDMYPFLNQGSGTRCYGESVRPVRSL